jgi:hypothetical protein
MTVNEGMAVPVAGYGDGMTPWVRHHVEEIGNLPHFLPDLFRDEAGVEPS